MSNRPYTNPFGVLGLPPTASREEVKSAFRRLALKCHPDVDPSPQAAARFTEVRPVCCEARWAYKAADVRSTAHRKQVQHAGWTLALPPCYLCVCA